jgi:hypothetical protein
MKIVSGVVMGGAGLAWLAFVISWIQAVRHPAPGQTTFGLLVNGFAVFQPERFTAEGNRHRRRCGLAMGAFFALVMLGIAVTALAKG